MKQVLAVLICLSIVNFVVSGAPTHILTSCCRKYSKKVPSINRIQRYEIQTNNGHCRIDAVKFTVAGKRICSDPKNKRVIATLKQLSEKEQKMKMMLILWD
ncbi:monocyte chemotactic protein 1B-like [Pristis pectinata]|uniref:monocyte chemotactic protein 1B-like n=1 Tax=Pristis pectinata TaxID=685728 RepID=UPI00223C987A|nr:monocyte chemotactic protein 1B-like [Pristis pectinata]